MKRRLTDDELTDLWHQVEWVMRDMGGWNVKTQFGSIHFTLDKPGLKLVVADMVTLPTRCAPAIPSYRFCASKPVDEQIRDFRRWIKNLKGSQ